MPELRVYHLNVMEEAQWSFAAPYPQWVHRFRGHRATFDPFPAYPHDLAEVTRAAATVAGHWPPRIDIDLYVADREDPSRTNGYSTICETGHYEGEEAARQWVKDPLAGLIMLGGKRIPPHPAVTRYLVGHEYGHHAEWAVNQADGAHWHDSQTIDTYSRVRGLTTTSAHHGEGGTWHNSASEIFACDFRILVCEVECGYWPHPDVPRPEEISGLRQWWQDALERVKAASERSD